MRARSSSLVCLTITLGLASCGEPVADDLGKALASEEGCGDACTKDSSVVGGRFALSSLAHGVAGDVVVVDDGTLQLERFDFDGGGLDVRAIVAADDADFSSGDFTVISDDLRRPGGYDGATLTFKLPEGLHIDDVGAFAIWCVPVGATFGAAVIADDG